MTLVLLGGGRSARFSKSAGVVTNKLSLPFGGTSVLGAALLAFSQFDFKNIILVADEALLPSDLSAQIASGASKITKIAQPGRDRAQSAYNALVALEALGGDDLVLIHDGARPLVPNALVARVIKAARAFGAAVPAVALTDTIKKIGEESLIGEHLARGALVAVQTPQAFSYPEILEAAKLAQKSGGVFTDDSELYEHFTQKKVKVVEGDERNIKITTALDYKRALAIAGERTLAAPPSVMVGLGYDSHALVGGRTLVVGGIKLPSALGEAAHSDGDALCHAVIDAIATPTLGRDVGELFPPNDDEWRGACSIGLLEKVASLLQAAHWRVANLDAVIKLDAPKLSPYKLQIRKSLANALGVTVERISVKAKTWEGFSNQTPLIEAQAVARLVQAPLGGV